MRNIKSVLALILATLVFCSMALPGEVKAATVTPRASDYLSSYSVTNNEIGSGKIRITCTVNGTGIMDELGMHQIKIYESTDNSRWSLKKTFTRTNTPSLMSYNDYTHSASVTYQGTAGRYYRAYVTFWAGKGGSGDYRYLWSVSRLAT